MTKQAFAEKSFNTKSKAVLDRIIPIVQVYQQQGYRMTLRQVYYQLVSKIIIPNNEKEYRRLSRLLTDARMTGLVDWEFIEDRHREIQSPSEFNDLSELIDAACDSYRLPRWAEQDTYIEVWVEKSALAGVISPITNEFHCRLVINKGYASATFMYEASQRFSEALDDGKNPILLYLGDHDPSGEDMVRDIGSRLSEFDLDSQDMEVRKIALTMDQVHEYSLPPNPAKMTDPRAPGYVEQHGNESWELDALPPNVLNQLVKQTILEFLDLNKYNKVIEQEEAGKARLRSITEGRA